MYKIKKCTAQDCKIVYEMICTLEDDKLNFNYFKKAFENNIKSRNVIYLKCIDNKEIIGFMSCHIQNLLHHDFKVAEIQEMYVDSGFRNKGIGSLLIQYVIDILKNKNVKLIEVTAQKKRIKAHRFYQMNKFKHSHKKFTRQI